MCIIGGNFNEYFAHTYIRIIYRINTIYIYIYTYIYETSLRNVINRASGEMTTST